MKRLSLLFVAAMLALSSCREPMVVDNPVEVLPPGSLELDDVARILSRLPMQAENLDEVYQAVHSSSGNGYDEEYMMSDLFTSPGTGVGAGGADTRASSYNTPLRDLFAEYFSQLAVTKSGSPAALWIESLSKSDIQIYWPYSDDWDGHTYPVITFDPGFGAESNYGYEVSVSETGLHVVDSIYVDEAVAMSRPVWVINRNDDSSYTPLQLVQPSVQSCASAASGHHVLKMKSFKMLRNYDSWFGGASEFFVKIGAVDGFKATKDEDLKLYTPQVNDFMINVRRKDVKVIQNLNCLLLSDFTDQMESIAFMIIEDDGGTTTSWKASAVVKYNSKSYGFDLDLPYKDKDDIVWRGQLSRAFFFNVDDSTPRNYISGRFGDVEVSFTLQ